MKVAATKYLSPILALHISIAPLVGQTLRADIEKTVDALLAQMTLKEKLGQLQQLDGHGDGNYRPEHRELIQQGLLGSLLNVRGAARTNELQRTAVEKSRLKIPVLFAFDVIHGYRTIFPVPLAEASSWDPAVAERAASVAAAEASAAGVRWTFAPMVDIARDPRWGRIVEGAGEDPFLGAAMARARVRGFQGRDYSARDKVLACAKHWVAYGAAEGGRDYNTTDVPERTSAQARRAGSRRALMLSMIVRAQRVRNRGSARITLAGQPQPKSLTAETRRSSPGSVHRNPCQKAKDFRLNGSVLICTTNGQILGRLERILMRVFLGANASSVLTVSRPTEHAGCVRSQGRNLCVSAVRFFGCGWAALCSSVVSEKSC